MNNLFQRERLNAAVWFDPRDTWTWRKVRKQVLAEHPLCCLCPARAREVHHEVPIHVDASQAFVLTKLWPVCEPCHLYAAHEGNYSNWVVNFRDLVEEVRDVRDRTLVLKDSHKKDKSAFVVSYNTQICPVCAAPLLPVLLPGSGVRWMRDGAYANHGYIDCPQCHSPLEVLVSVSTGIVVSPPFQKESR